MRAFIAILLLLPLLAWAPIPPGGSGSTRFRSTSLPIGPSQCLTSTDSKTGTTAGTVELGGSAYNATPFVAGSSYPLCKVVLRMLKTGSPTYTMTCGIYSHDAGNNAPNVLLGQVSTAVAAGSLSTSEADVTFSGMSANISSGTTYWIVVFCSLEFQSPNVARWANVSESLAHGEMSSSTGSPGSWTEVDAFSRYKWTTYQ